MYVVDCNSIMLLGLGTALDVAGNIVDCKMYAFFRQHYFVATPTIVR